MRKLTQSDIFTCTQCNDFELCADCESSSSQSDIDIATVEYYSNLSAEERVGWLDASSAASINDATLEEIKRIDRGLKAHCLS
jgi:hypothetical protein